MNVGINIYIKVLGFNEFLLVLKRSKRVKI